MDDEQGGAPTSADVTLMLEQVAAGFPSRFPSYRCTFCGDKDLFFIDTAGSNFRSRLVLYNEKAEITGYFPTANFVCQTCGHLYSFTLKTLHRAIIDAADHDGPTVP